MNGDLFIIAAASGTGKTNLIRCLGKKIPSLKICISHTTRPRRPGEREGRDYFFVATAEFKRMETAGDFIETAVVYGNDYGTTRRELERQREGDNDVLLELDWQGAQAIKKQYPRAISIFVLPPSIEHLKLRLHQRGTDSPIIIEERASIFKNEIAQHHLFDYLVVNEEFDQACEQLYCILTAHGLQFVKQKNNLRDLLERLK